MEKLKAIYMNPEGLQDVLLFVLRENRDGTVDLGDQDGRLLLGKCPIATSPIDRQEGHCRIVAK